MSSKKQIPSNSMELKQLAELAKSLGFKWIAQDGHNEDWWGYTSKPNFYKRINRWHVKNVGNCAYMNLTDNDRLMVKFKYNYQRHTIDYSKQIFNVNELLNNEQ